MFDEIERLRKNAHLLRLLTYYAQLSVRNEETWHDRLMEMTGLNGRDLVRLHGVLIASGWLEQNTGTLSNPRPGQVPGCYRITPLGKRALQNLLLEVES